MRAIHDEVRVTSSVTANAIWQLVSDLPRLGRFSPEYTGGQWLDGVSEPATGARFRGRNRWGPIRWSTTCEIVNFVPPECLSFEAVHWSGARTRWTYRLRAEEGATHIGLSYRTVDSPTAILLLDCLFGRPGRLRSGIKQTLARIVAAAECGHP